MSVRVRQATVLGLGALLLAASFSAQEKTPPAIFLPPARSWSVIFWVRVMSAGWVCS